MASKRSPAKQAELKANYTRLRESGYSPKEASRLRSASPDTIRTALNTNPRSFRQAKPLSERHARSGGGGGERYKKLNSFQPAPTLDYKVHKGRIKASDYEEITPQSDRVYANEWAYKMTYIVVDKNGIETRKYFTILPDEKMNKKQLKQFVSDHCQGSSESRYQAKIIKGSIELIGMYHNADWA